MSSHARALETVTPPAATRMDLTAAGRSAGRRASARPMRMGVCSMNAPSRRGIAGDLVGGIACWVCVQPLGWTAARPLI
jgi:hypothetical protein